jgi:salicylate hydroxylase
MSMVFRSRLLLRWQRPCGTSEIRSSCPKVFFSSTTTPPSVSTPNIQRDSSPIIEKPSVAIIGAGIGGLATANALLYQDCVSSLKVYEQASHFVPTAGAGFGFSPNGQICLEFIGISAQEDCLLHPFDYMVRLNHDGNDIQQRSNVLQQIREKHGFGIGGCLRADLVDLLVNALGRQTKSDCTVKYSHTLTHMAQVADKVELEFANGHSDVVDLVVGADGIHSFVARTMQIDHSEPIYANANIFYGVIDNATTDEVRLAWKSPLLRQDLCHTVMQSHGIGEFIVFHVGPPNNTKLVWAATYPADGPPAKQEEWDVAQNKNELDGILKKFPPSHVIHELAETTQDERLLHFGLYHRQHKKTWFQDRVVLLGDSCHATLPYVGQGANQAIEDAIVLADCLATGYNETRTAAIDTNTASGNWYQTAFQQYYDRRFQRTKRIVTIANVMNTLYHSRNFVLQYMLDVMLSQIVKGGMLFKQIEKEIVDECPVKDYGKYRKKLKQPAPEATRFKNE